jgi:hypothetical protein
MIQDLVKETKALETMDLARLKERYREVFGEEPVGRKKKVLIDQIRRRLFQHDIEEKRKARAAAGSITDRIAGLTKMSLAELRAEYEAVLGKKSRSRNRHQLTKRIADKLQQDAYQEKMAGGAKPTVTAKFERKRKTRSKRQIREPGQRDPRLPKAGTTIERLYKGEKLLVRVLDEGFEYQGKPYRSLSALAKHITGQIVNGFAWFRLGDYAKQEKASK